MPHQVSPHPLDHSADTEWPAYVPAICAAIVASNMLLAVTQNRFNGYRLLAGMVAVGAILLPFVTDAVTSLLPNFAARLQEPRWWLFFFPVPVALGVGYFMFHPAEVDVSPFVLVFMTGELVSRSRGRNLLAVYAGLIAVGTVILAEVLGPWSTGAGIWVAGISFGWLGGFLIRELDTRTHELEAAQAGLAEKAATEERSRIAREVHDVIAHSLSVTMLHIGAARMALQKGDRTQEAIDSLREAEEQGRRSLSEIRRTVGLLGDEGQGSAPMPTTTDIPKLVGDFREAGLDATLDVDGDLGSLPPATGLNLYRIVQESLTNVAKHAPSAKANVHLAVSDRDIRLRVHNDLNGTRPPRGDGGLGLRGMAERAETIGGELSTDDADGWTVTLVARRPPA